jgi:hypothetical protein
LGTVYFWQFLKQVFGSKYAFNNSHAGQAATNGKKSINGAQQSSAFLFCILIRQFHGIIIAKQSHLTFLGRWLREILVAKRIRTHHVNQFFFGQVQHGAFERRENNPRHGLVLC